MSANIPHPKFYKRSLSMAEALQQPNDLEQPIPFAIKVKNAARDFLMNDQKCHWIQYMQNYDTTPLRHARGVRPKHVGSNCDTNEQENKNNQDLLKKLPQAQKSAASSYSEQLEILQKQQEEILERQHRLEEQLAQHKKSQELLSLEQTLAKPDVSEYSKNIQPYLGVQDNQHTKQTKPISGFRRRLKGSVAEFSAKRSEGSIASLMYYMDDSKDDLREAMPVRGGESTPRNDVSLREAEGPDQGTTFTSSDIISSPSECTSACYRETSPVRSLLLPNTKGSSPAALGRLQAKSQESGLAVRELLNELQ